MPLGSSSAEPPRNSPKSRARAVSALAPFGRPAGNRPAKFRSERAGGPRRAVRPSENQVSERFAGNSPARDAVCGTAQEKHATLRLTGTCAHTGITGICKRWQQRLAEPGIGARQPLLDGASSGSSGSQLTNGRYFGRSEHGGEPDGGDRSAFSAASAAAIFSSSGGEYFSSSSGFFTAPPHEIRGTLRPASGARV